jgi:hypothetical protein
MKYFEKFNVEMNQEAMTLRITKDAPRSRMGFKLVVNYRFRSVEAMENWFVKVWVAGQEKIQEAELKARAAKKMARENWVNPYQVGQVFYDSWGYEQTNIDFYQVIEVGKMSVKIRKIGQVMSREAGFMCEYLMPAVNEFIGEAETKIIVLDRKGVPHINGYRGWISEWDGREKYQSHYA